MSIGAVRTQGHIPDIDAAKVLLERLAYTETPSRINYPNAFTQEERLSAEAEVIATLEALTSGELTIEAVDGAYPSWEDRKKFTNALEFLSSYSSERLSALARLYLHYYNSHRASLMDIDGRLRRIRQKKAVLDLWEDNEVKWVLAEKFLTLDHLDTNLTSEAACHVDTRQGIMTLPVSKKTKLTVGSVTIASGSNGRPGNSDSSASSLYTDVRNVISDNDIHFEYEKMDTGPCELRLLFQLPKETVLNHIEIVPSPGNTEPFEVVDAWFGRSSGAGVRLGSILPGDLPDDYFSVQGGEGSWTCTFIPIPVQTVSIRLRQTSSEEIESYSRDLTETMRKRFGIGLLSVSLYKIAYTDRGGLNSKSLPLPGGLYACSPKHSVYPVNGGFYDLEFRYSTDGGASWTDDLSGSDTALLDGTEQSLVWKFAAEVVKDFDLDVITGDASTFDVNSVSRSISPKVSPAVIRLPELPSVDKVACLRKLGRRTNNVHRSVYLGTGKSFESLFPLPFDIDEIGISPDEVRVYVNRREWSAVDDAASLGAGYFMFSADHRSIIFSSDLPDKASVHVAFDEERCDLEERADGYYVYPRNLFDPDSCVLTHTPSVLQRKMRILPRGSTRISFGVTGIDPDSFSIISSNGTVYVSQPSRSALGAAVDYYLDAENGILYLHTAIAADTARCVFSYASRATVSADSVTVIYDDILPKALRLDKSALTVQSFSDTVGGALASRFDINAGEFSTRADVLSAATDAMTLSHDYIVRGSVRVGPELMGYSGSLMVPVEEEYVDGRSEFLGLIEVNDEQTTSIQADAVTGLSSFTLGAGGLYYSVYDVEFSSTYTNKCGTIAALAAVGDYHIDELTGEVTVFGDVSAGVSMSYFYRDPEYDSSNRFSVNYEKGHLFTSEPMVNGSAIEYLVAQYSLAYDLVEDVFCEYSESIKSLSVPTEAYDTTQQIKVLWKKKAEDLIQDLSNYFSPIIYSLGLRFE